MQQLASIPVQRVSGARAGRQGPHRAVLHGDGLRPDASTAWRSWAGRRRSRWSTWPSAAACGAVLVGQPPGRLHGAMGRRRRGRGEMAPWLSQCGCWICRECIRCSYGIPSLRRRALCFDDKASSRPFAFSWRWKAFRIRHGSAGTEINPTDVSAELMERCQRTFEASRHIEFAAIAVAALGLHVAGGHELVDLATAAARPITWWTPPGIIWRLPAAHVAETSTPPGSKNSRACLNGASAVVTFALVSSRRSRAPGVSRIDGEDPCRQPLLR